MRKVRNGKVIRKIADRTRKAGKNRNIIAVLAIALTALLFTSIFTVGGSIINKQQESTCRQVGTSSHGGFKFLTQEEYDIVKKDQKLKSVSCRRIVGSAENEELIRIYTEVNCFEDLDAEMNFCYPTEGRMPQNRDEIVTSDLVLKELGIPCKIGAEVPVKVKVGDVLREETFTLSGYYRGDTIAPAQYIEVSKAYADEVAPTPKDSMLGKVNAVAEYAGRIMADFSFASSRNLEKQIEDLKERCGFPEDMAVGMNWAYLGAQMDVEVIILVAVLLAVILMSGYLIIYNIFYINVFSDIRHYGLLKTIGTTGKQLKKIVRRQAYMLSLVGIPIGLIGGALVGKVLLPIVMQELTFSESVDTNVTLNPWIFAGAAAFALFTVYISCIKPCRIAAKVSPIEALKFTEGQEIQEKIHGKKGSKEKGKKTRKVTPREMALQNIKRNKKKVIVVVTSLSMSLVLLNSVYGMVTGFDMDSFVASKVVSDFSVSDATLDNLNVDLEAKVVDGVTEEFRQALSEQEGIREMGNLYMSELIPTFTDEDFARIEERVLDNPAAKPRLNVFSAGDTEEYIQWIKEDRHIDGRIYGIDKMIFDKLEDREGEINWEKFSTGKYVIGAWYEWTDMERIPYVKPGEKVTLYNAQGESREYEVLGLADLPGACQVQMTMMMEYNFILPEEEYLDFYGERRPMRTLIDVEKGHETSFKAWISDYCENVNPELQYISKETIAKEFEDTKQMYSLVGGMLAFILAVIGILNFINTIVTSILSRKQEFAMMEAVGMTGSQLRRMLCFEGGYYAAFTVVVSLMLGGILDATVVRNIGNSFFFFDWHFTVTPILACTPVLLAVVLIVPAVCYKKMCKMSVVERMRKAE